MEAMAGRVAHLPSSSRWRGLAALALGLLLAAPACKEPPREVPTLAQLEADEDVKQAGRWLMAVPEGMHRLDTTAPTPVKVVLGVHGHGSEGYEWIQPLTTMDDTGAQVQFYRWDWDQCPEPAAQRLDQAVDELLQSQPMIEELQVIAHSYGGVISALMASRYDGRVPLTVDLVASPLAGFEQLRDRCGYDGPQPPAAGVTLRMWRTRKELDNAFSDMPEDPQRVELPGEVTELPESYRGHRLGHNWSISWVVERLVSGQTPPA